MKIQPPPPVASNKESVCYKTKNVTLWFKKETVKPKLIFETLLSYHDCGVLHNLEGPSIIYAHNKNFGLNHYFIDGKLIDYKEYDRAVEHYKQTKKLLAKGTTKARLNINI